MSENAPVVRMTVGRPATVPEAVRGRRRADPRCETCRWFRLYQGPTPWTAWTGEAGEAWVCHAHGKELTLPERRAPCREYIAR